MPTRYKKKSSDQKECKHPTCGPVCRRPKKVKKRVAIKRTQVKKRPYRIKKVSAKRKEENKIYSERRALFLKRHPLCRANLEGCLRLSDQVHHSEGREGENFLDESKWVPICGICHSIITDNPKLGIELGLSNSRHGQKADNNG